MSEGFMLDLDTATLFFRVCRRYRVDGREQRVMLMRELVRRKKAKYLRDVESVLEGKRIIGFKKGDDNDEKSH